MNFFAQLRQRRIVQIIVSYLAVGWIFLSVVDQLADRGVIPNLVYSVTLILVLFGMVAAGLIGWNHGEKGKQEAPRSEIIALFVLAILALGSSGFVVRQDLTHRRFKNAAEHPLELQKIAVMYFKDYTEDPDLAYIADGLTEDLVRALEVGDLNVLSKNATSQFRGQDPPLDSVATVLNVGTVVDGSVEKRGPDIEVTLRLVDGKSGAVVQRTKIKMPAKDVLAVRDSVVEQSANWLREWIGKELRVRSSERGTDVREAWALVQRAENARKAAEAAVHVSGPSAGEPKFAEATQYLEQAQKLDPKWVEPFIQQTAITYRRSRLAVAGGAADQAVKLIEEGLKQAEAVLAMSRNEPRGLELRGTLHYLKWLLNVTPDAAERAKLFADAETDLEQAVQLEPSLASAHNTLSHLLLQKPDLGSAMVEARLAYEKDAYLEVVSDVVWRLFWGHFDQGSFTQSREWCDKGSARFRDDYRYRFCQLRLMASPAVTADPAKAWSLVAQIDSLVPQPKKELERIRAQMSVAGVLGRAGLRDSADKVMARAHSAVNLDIDPTYDLVSYEATMRLLYGEKDQAFELLRQMTKANPDQGFKKGEPLQWMWRDLQDHPRLNELYAPE